MFNTSGGLPILRASSLGVLAHFPLTGGLLQQDNFLQRSCSNSHGLDGSLFFSETDIYLSFPDPVPPLENLQFLSPTIVPFCFPLRKVFSRCDFLRSASSCRAGCHLPAFFYLPCPTSSAFSTAFGFGSSMGPECLSLHSPPPLTPISAQLLHLKSDSLPYPLFRIFLLFYFHDFPQTICSVAGTRIADRASLFSGR